VNRTSICGVVAVVDAEIDVIAMTLGPESARADWLSAALLPYDQQHQDFMST
jgi:hypothetical protein